MPRFPDADELCAQLISEAGCSPPPTDLEAISSLWPRLKVSEENLDREGYLIYLGVQGAELILNRNDSPNRKRFTWAHELGHWVLSHSQRGEFSLYNTVLTTRSVHGSRQSPEEHWCNDFAGKLLMPTSEIRDYLGSNVDDFPRRLVSGHAIFQVSEEAFLTRITDALGWIIVYLIQGPGLHKIGRRFQSRYANRKSGDELVEDLLNQTHGMLSFTDSEIRLPGLAAYGCLKTATRETSTYLVCLMAEHAS